MEARATLNGSSISKTFVAAVLVLVAMGLGAMGGYFVKGLGASGASTTVTAPVLRQHNPPAKAVEVPIYGVDESARPSGAPRLSQGATDDNQVIGTRGNHGQTN